jgi:hypothetical protein
VLFCHGRPSRAVKEQDCRRFPPCLDGHCPGPTRKLPTSFRTAPVLRRSHASFTEYITNFVVGSSRAWMILAHAFLCRESARRIRPCHRVNDQYCCRYWLWTKDPFPRLTVPLLLVLSCTPQMFRRSRPFLECERNITKRSCHLGKAPQFQHSC